MENSTFQSKYGINFEILQEMHPQPILKKLVSTEISTACHPRMQPVSKGTIEHKTASLFGNKLTMTHLESNIQKRKPELQKGMIYVVELFTRSYHWTRHWHWM